MRSALIFWGVLVSPLGMAAILLGVSACGGGGTGLEPTTRTIYMKAIEPKGSAEVAKEPFPTEPLPAGGGYVLKEPKDGKWEVETYTWAPDQVIVTQGDTVNLEIIGINGASHDSTIEGYADSFLVERGKITQVSFVADKAGVFKIICKTHQPSMTAELVVLPG